MDKSKRELEQELFNLNSKISRVGKQKAELETELDILKTKKKRITAQLNKVVAEEERNRIEIDWSG